MTPTNLEPTGSDLANQLNQLKETLNFSYNSALKGTFRAKNMAFKVMRSCGYLLRRILRCHEHHGHLTGALLESEWTFQAQKQILSGASI
jgi:hypothetical protein